MTEIEVFWAAIPVVMIIFSIIWYFTTLVTSSRWWCNTFHPGGSIKPDHTGQVNWQCDHCGRWHYNRD